jgi:hypothetical protein
MRVRGRKIWASSLEERRVLMALGGVPLRVPRGVSPFMIARRLARAAATVHPDVLFVREMLTRRTSSPLRDGSTPSITDEGVVTTHAAASVAA